MKIETRRGGVVLLLCGLAPQILSGCGSNQSQTPAPISKGPAPTIGAAEKKFIASAISMSPQQQGELFRKNPQMTQNPAVMAKIRAEMPKVVVKQTHGEKPRLPTGRPSLPVN